MSLQSLDLDMKILDKYLGPRDRLDNVDLVASLCQRKGTASHHLLVPQLHWAIVLTPGITTTTTISIRIYLFILYLICNIQKPSLSLNNQMG